MRIWYKTRLEKVKKKQLLNNDNIPDIIYKVPLIKIVCIDSLIKIK